ncbi:hypothetical protein EYR36_003213 [Pleurotus pulmonarius]|nr:hypothetical protein EYR36_003213 [Pleurotus pulmonarius]
MRSLPTRRRAWKTHMSSQDGCHEQGRVPIPGLGGVPKVVLETEETSIRAREDVVELQGTRPSVSVLTDSPYQWSIDVGRTIAVRPSALCIAPTDSALSPPGRRLALRLSLRKDVPLKTQTETASKSPPKNWPYPSKTFHWGSNYFDKFQGRRTLGLLDPPLDLAELDKTIPRTLIADCQQAKYYSKSDFDTVFKAQAKETVIRDKVKGKAKGSDANAYQVATDNYSNWHKKNIRSKGLNGSTVKTEPIASEIKRKLESPPKEMPTPKRAGPENQEGTDNYLLQSPELLSTPPTSQLSLRHRADCLALAHPFSRSHWRPPRLTQLHATMSQPQQMWSPQYNRRIHGSLGELQRDLAITESKSYVSAGCYPPLPPSRAICKQAWVLRNLKATELDFKAYWNKEITPAEKAVFIAESEKLVTESKGQAC